ncbi:MAG TPA: 16S rRNA (guanine(527)-N(7))-methyltransferase RsmG [Candidatus Cloacimonadota bacterium]|nr:16S rRNA (guanine(527)-N(7))-methyltransferase RsmG [Candidatus Cloacimonadota bacterium]
MNAERQMFAEFLRELGVEDPEPLARRFDHYLELLLEQNAMVNLISRTTQPRECWTKHFLDSLMPLKCLDLSTQRALDFGSGGGLPGIPLKLLRPGLRIQLLDSVAKKTRALEHIAQELDLHDLSVINARLEDHVKSTQRYELIFCRAVKLEERYRLPLWKLLSKGGQVIFYKALDSSDLEGLQPKLLCKQEFSWGSRSIMAVERENLRH